MPSFFYLIFCDSDMGVQFSNEEIVNADRKRVQPVQDRHKLATGHCGHVTSSQ